MESYPDPFFNKQLNRIKKNGINTTRKLCNIFRFTDNLKFIYDSGEFEIIYSNTVMADHSGNVPSNIVYSAIATRP